MIVPSGFGSSKVAQMEARAETRVHSLLPATIDKLKRDWLWDKVQLLMMPDAYSEGKLHAINQAGTSDADFTVSRGSAKNTIDNEGYIRKVPANYPSIDYSIGKPVLRTDQQAQNKLLYWKSFENSYWAKSNCTIDDNGGAYYASPLKDDSGNVVLQSRRIYDTNDSSAVQHYIISSTLQITGGNSVSINVIAKTGTLNTIVIESYSQGYYDDSVYYNFETDTFFNGTSHVESFSSLKLANGFVMIKVKFTTDVNSTGTRATVSLVKSSLLYQGDGTGYVEVAYTQFNEGEATGIICPYDAAENQLVSRLADDISITTPSGVTKITETFADDTENVITTIPSTYLLTNDKEYSKIIME